MHRFVSMIVHNQGANHAICGQLGIDTVDKCPKRTMPPSIQNARGGKLAGRLWCNSNLCLLPVIAGDRQPAIRPISV